MTTSTSDLQSLILFEDEHLLVVNKPAGLNTQAPSPFAGEGLYDWLRQREPRWARFVEGEPLLLEHLVEPVAPPETVPQTAPSP